MPDRRLNKRDDRGWRIPRRGTRSYAIYRRLLAGKSPFEIHAEIGGSLKIVQVLSWKIQHPAATNAIQQAYRKNRDAEDAA